MFQIKVDWFRKSYILMALVFSWTRKKLIDLQFIFFSRIIYFLFDQSMHLGILYENMLSYV